MEKQIKTNKQQFTLVCQVSTASKQNLRVILTDTDYQNTEYTNRNIIINGVATFYIQVPLCNNNAKLIIYNEATGNVPSQSDSTFRLLKCFMIPLEKRFDLVDYKETGLASYLDFCQRFCLTAGWIPSDTYRSDDYRYMIQYLPDIFSSDYPYQPLNTSARICKDYGIIQASQKQFEVMTVPMRMVILLHEYAHFFVNNDIEDETEADLNALTIYLGLGYPRIDAQNAFTDAFLGAAYPMNMDRMQIIQDFIKHFDESQIVIIPD